ncbi:MAG TPA: hypothetical protein VGK19_04520 [Capsulimonadaceae bacterium]|jgi:hypothetical protein
MYLNALNLFGLILNFTGTVLLSAGLLRSNEQIRDEESSYWDGNPYTTKNAPRAQPYYNAGFRLLVAGFAINIAVEAYPLIPASGDVQVSFAAVALAMLGFLIVQSFQVTARAAHLTDKERLLVSGYRQAVEGLLEEAKEDSEHETWQQPQNFQIRRDARSKQLRTQLIGCPERFGHKIAPFIDKVEKANGFEEYIACLSNLREAAATWKSKQS